jgi:hypothetical protein
MEAKFTIGDKVIALSSSVNNEQLRVKGNSYIVNAVGYCSGCGSQIINVSGETKIQSGKCACGNIQASKGLWWTNSIHFIKADDNSISEAIKEAIETENYELASTLRDLTNNPIEL